MAEVGCAGILVADVFCGPMPRLPAEGELLPVGAMPARAGGCAANVAIDLARQDVSVDVAGCVGNDAAAQMLLGSLGACGIGCRHITFSDAYPTSQTVILLVEGQDRRYIHNFGANRAFSEKGIDRPWLSSLKVFYLGGLFAMPAMQPDALAEVMQFCRSRGIVTVVDVVIPREAQNLGALKSLLPYVDYFIPNEDEAALITGLSGPRDQLRALRQMGAACVVVTLGKNGAMASQGRRYWQCAAHDVKAIDPSGSGDAFAAGVVLGALKGWGMAQTLQYASALGASATQAIGTTDGVFDSQRALRFIADHPLAITEGSL